MVVMTVAEKKKDWPKLQLGVVSITSVADLQIKQSDPVADLEWKFMSYNHVKSLVNLLTWLLIGWSLLCSQSETSLLVDPTFDSDYNS